jgi:MFS family permease
MISENSTPKTQATAFSYFAFTAFLATFLGPLLGGILCNPADQYPALFGKVQFFIDYPYALPNFATGLFGASAALLTALYVEEVCS